MNNIIKRLIIILILNSSFLIQIFSQELIITIPKKFNNNEFPLPPFPKEVINKLKVTDYELDLIDNIYIRDISLSEIEYNYYNSFLNNKLHEKSILYQTGIIGFNLDSILLGYSPEYVNNKFSITGDVYYRFITNNLGLNLAYSDYRFPINMQMSLDVPQNHFNFKLGVTNYYKEWFVSSTLSLTGSDIHLYFKNRQLFNPLGEIYFKDVSNNYGTFSLGFNNINLGLGIIDLKPMPYIDISKIYNNFTFTINTSIESKKADYSFNMLYTDNNYIGLGFGFLSNNNFLNLDPYIVFKENYLFGERIYRITKDEINFTFSFIKDDLASIISLNITNSNIASFNFEMDYKNYGIISDISYIIDQNNYNLGLYFTYKAGEL